MSRNVKLERNSEGDNEPNGLISKIRIIDVKFSRGFCSEPVRLKMALE
jgi:hypothetical protein